MTPTNIYISQTNDCITLNGMEKVALLAVKGILYEFAHSRSEPYNKELDIYHITVSEKQEGDDYQRIVFEIEGAHHGHLAEIKRTLKNILVDDTFIGGYYELNDKIVFSFRRYEMEREKIVCYVPKYYTQK